MGDPKNGNSNSSDKNKSDRGGWPLSDNGQRSAPNRPAPPKPEYNPNK